MANGDKAAAVGMDTVAGTEDIRLSYDEINKSRDYLADHQTDGSHRAEQITTGVFPPARGGTGFANVYSQATDTAPNPTSGRRLVLVDTDGKMYSLRNGDIPAAYLGFRIHGDVSTLDFDAGHAVIEHGLSWTPTVVLVTARLDNIALMVTRSENPPTSTGAGVMAYNDDGTGFDGLCNVEWIAWGAA